MADAPVEIERKWCCGEVPAGLDVGTAIDQGYLTDDTRVAVRIRRRGTVCTLTIKAGAGTSRTEVERELDRAEFDALWPLTEGRRIEKRRHLVELGSHTAEVDVFGGELAGLVLVEVEFDSVAEADAFEPPAWFGTDVTDDGRYTNAALAEAGRPPSGLGDRR